MGGAASPSPPMAAAAFAADGGSRLRQHGPGRLTEGAGASVGRVEGEARVHAKGSVRVIDHERLLGVFARDAIGLIADEHVQLRRGGDESLVCLRGG
jgi:hypothetical protein